MDASKRRSAYGKVKPLACALSLFTMDDILAAAAKLQEPYKHLQERNSRLTAALEDKSKKLQALHQSVEQRGKDLAALELQVQGTEAALVAHDKFAEELRLRAGSRVKLDVGGVHFTTSLTTLMTEPDSMLAAMFSGRHELEKDDDGRVFIDRDGELFKYVLQYLREGELDRFQLPSGVKQRLKREAAFYCLPKLEEKLFAAEVERAYYPVHEVQGDVQELWRTLVLPVILERYRGYHLISVKENACNLWEVHLNRIVV